MPKLLRGRAPVKVCHTRHGVIRRAASPARRRQHRRSWHLDRLGAQTVCCCPSSVACTLLMTTICTHTCWHFARSISARFLLLLRSSVAGRFGLKLGSISSWCSRGFACARGTHCVSPESSFISSNFELVATCGVHFVVCAFLALARLPLGRLGSDFGWVGVGARDSSRVRVTHTVCAPRGPLFDPILSSW